jgi:hypothetical protein
MSFGELEIKDSEFSGQDIASLSDRPKLTASELKARFDNVAKNILAGRFNRLLTELDELTEGYDSAVSERYTKAESDELMSELQGRLSCEISQITEALANYATLTGLSESLTGLENDFTKRFEAYITSENLEQEIGELEAAIYQKLAEYASSTELNKGLMDLETAIDDKLKECASSSELSEGLTGLRTDLRIVCRAMPPQQI